MFRCAFLLLFLFSAADPCTPGKFYWRGMVDDRVDLAIHAEKLESKTISGRPYPEGVYSFTAPLPEEAVTVSAAMVKGRGTVKVIDQPSQDNDFTAVVEIVDDKSGAKEYQLEITWN